MQLGETKHSPPWIVSTVEKRLKMQGGKNTEGIEESQIKWNNVTGKYLCALISPCHCYQQFVPNTKAQKRYTLVF